MDVFDGTSERDVGTRYDQSADQGADSGPTLVIEQKPDAVADSECSEDEYGDSQLTQRWEIHRWRLVGLGTVKRNLDSGRVTFLLRSNHDGGRIYCPVVVSPQGRHDGRSCPDWAIRPRTVRK